MPARLQQTENFSFAVADTDAQVVMSDNLATYTSLAGSETMQIDYTVPDSSQYSLNHYLAEVTGAMVSPTLTVQVLDPNGLLLVSIVDAIALSTTVRVYTSDLITTDLDGWNAMKGRFFGGGCVFRFQQDVVTTAISETWEILPTFTVKELDSLQGNSA